jgi:hypothetical protein
MTKVTSIRKIVAPAKATKAASAGPTPSASRANAIATRAQAKSSGEAAHATATRPKHKLVRDSFTIPKSEYLALEALKARATDLKRPTKKSEMLRAGIAALQVMGDAAFLRALNSVPSLKTGRPTGSPLTTARAAKKAVR